MSTPGVTHAPGGFRIFTVIWFGQVVSLIGSGLTAFALGVWVYQQTGSVTRFALIAAFASIPGILLSPLAGALVDRWDRRRTMILSDAGAALCTAALVALLFTGRLAIWHIYVVVAVASAFGALQFPAFSAASTLLIPKRHFGRAGGMMQFGHSAAEILAPLLAGLLMVSLGLAGVIAIDLATFGVALSTLALVRVPRPPRSAAADEGRGSLLREALYGWSYVRARPGLLRLLGLFAALNLTVPIGLVLVTPLVLSFAAADELGLVLSVGAVGGLVGGLLMSAWGGPRRKMLGILGFGPLVSVGLIAAGLRPSVPLIAAGLFAVFFVIPIVNGCSQAIWQSKVDPAVQGRVFAFRRMVAQITAPLAFFLAGPLAERVFEPLMVPGGALAGSLGGLLGTGEGRGIGLMFLAVGVGFALVIAWGFAQRSLRLVEDDLPDALAVGSPSEA